MRHFERSADILHDLLHIQQERTLVYEQLTRYPDQEESILKFLQEVLLQSRNSVIQLRGHVDVNCGDPADRVILKGDIYRDWPGLKFFPPSSSPQEICLYCEYNEQEILRAYKKAINSEDLCDELRPLLLSQLKALRESFKKLHEWKDRPVAPVSTDERTAFGFSRYASLSEPVE